MRGPADPLAVGRKVRAAKATAKPAMPLTPEWEFQANVIELMLLCGWEWHHTPDAAAQKIPPRVPSGKRGLKDAMQKTMGGISDLIGCRPPRVIFMELKREDGRVRPRQKVWLSKLAQCPGVETYLFRPSDWDAIVEVLR